MVSEKSINNVVTTWGLSSKIADTNLLFGITVTKVEIELKTSNKFIFMLNVFELLAEFVLDLNEALGFLVILKVWKLFVNLVANQLCEWLVLLDS